MLCLVLLGKPLKKNSGNVVNASKPSGGYHSVISHDNLECKIWDENQILPYYIVSYETPQTRYQQGSIKHLDEEWKIMETDAKADKFMDDVKKFYQESLKKKDLERKLGKIDPNDIWFDKIYSKRLEKEGGISGIEDLQSPTSPSFEGFIDDDSDETEDEKSPITPSE